MSGWTGKQNSSVVSVRKSIQSKKVIILCIKYNVAVLVRAGGINDIHVLSPELNDIKKKNDLWI